MKSIFRPIIMLLPYLLKSICALLWQTDKLEQVTNALMGDGTKREAAKASLLSKEGVVTCSVGSGERIMGQVVKWFSDSDNNSGEVRGDNGFILRADGAELWHLSE
jgi:hypothetical protein